MKAWIKKVIRRKVADFYWKVGANEEDNYAENAIIYDHVPRSANMDTIVAEIDRRATAMGGKAVRIMRDLAGDDTNHG